MMIFMTKIEMNLKLLMENTAHSLNAMFCDIYGTTVGFQVVFAFTFSL